jgi:hypothetical protein
MSNQIFLKEFALFDSGVFNEAVGSSDYVTSNDRMISSKSNN